MLIRANGQKTNNGLIFLHTKEMKKVKLYTDFLSATENLFSKVAVLFNVKKVVTNAFVTSTPSYFPRR